MTGPAEHDAVLTRCAATVTRAMNGQADDAEVDQAIAVLVALPGERPECGPLAAGLITALLRTNPTGPQQRLRQLNALLVIADRNPPALPAWPQLRAAARTFALLQAGSDRELADPRAALREVDELAAVAADSPALAGMFTSARMGLSVLAGLHDGDESDLLGMPAELDQLRQLSAGIPTMGATADAIGLAMELLAANQRGDRDGMWRAFDQLRAATDQLPPGHVMHEVTEETVVRMAPFRRMVTDDPAGIATDEELAALSALANRPGADRLLSLLGAGGAAFAGGNETDLNRLDAGIGYFRESLVLAPPGHPQRVFCLQSLALGLLRQSEVGGKVAQLPEALALLEQARELAGGPHHPQWSLINEMLADARRRLGQNPQARHAALDSLRSYAWRVLRQSDLRAAKVAARDAARDAIEIARWCLVDNEPADALRALDAGRALILFAATEMRDIASRLEEAGQSELARRWRAAATAAGPDHLPSDLRQEVLTALSSEVGSAAGLLDPPSLAQIRSALELVEADALVYLVPGASSMPGWAVIAAVDGPPAFMALPNLIVETDVDVERYLTALASRNAATVDPAPDASRDTMIVDDQFAGSLDTMCDWAWRAAIGPLVERYLDPRPAPASGRVPHVVLVPMGDLARIPWAAARRRDATFAVELVGLSYTASARALCDSASWEPVPPSSVGLVVGDPDTHGRARELLAARVEAFAIQQAFYRGARYVGRRGDATVSRSGAGTADEVRAWLTSSHPESGSMLHLACHGGLDDDPHSPTSYLLLAGGDPLSAEELIDVMARAPERGVGLVVLAACNTGRSVHGYDEAYSLGTAFLAGGARSVLSTQWSIPDAATSVLMFMFHHYRMRDELPAWQALRMAQLWMLDPDRTAPQQMPADLSRRVGNPGHAQVVAWAGFVHGGQ